MPRYPHKFVTVATTLMAALAALVLLPTAPAGAAATPANASQASHPTFMSPRTPGSVRPATVNSGINAVYRNGSAVLENHTSLWAIYWEPTNSVAAGYNDLTTQFLNDFTISPEYQIAAQYPDLSNLGPNGTRFAGSWVDTSAYPANPLLDNNIQQEVTRAKQVNGWPTQVNNIYLVFTQRGENVCFDSSLTSCAGTNFCAYHGFFNNNTTYAILPYAASGLPCSPGSSPNNNDADATINSIAATVFGASTDLIAGRGYTDNNNVEVENKCAFQFGPLDSFGGDVTLNRHEYILQKLWDNYTASCQLNPSTTILPGTWPRCNTEDGNCVLSTQQSFAFGANERYSYFDLTARTINCNTGAFGDPNNGTYKACYTQDIPPGNNTWTLCAGENSLCSFNGSTLTVAYGANGQYHYATVTNGITCNNANFGDPANGSVKACYITAPPPGTVSWTTCAAENDTCFFDTGVGGTHEVAFGANGHYVYLNITATPTSGVPCAVANFGADPAPGAAKACYWASTEF